MNFYSTKVCVSAYSGQYQITSVYLNYHTCQVITAQCTFLIQKYFVKPAIIKQLGISVVSRWG